MVDYGRIVYTVRETAQARGFENPFQLHRATRIEYGLCYRIWHMKSIRGGRAQRRFDGPVLARFCFALGCGIEEIVRYVPPTSPRRRAAKASGKKAAKKAGGGSKKGAARSRKK